MFGAAPGPGGISVVSEQPELRSAASAKQTIWCSSSPRPRAGTGLTKRRDSLLLSGPRNQGVALSLRASHWHRQTRMLLPILNTADAKYPSFKPPSSNGIGRAAREQIFLRRPLSVRHPLGDEARLVAKNRSLRRRPNYAFCKRPDYGFTRTSACH